MEPIKTIELENGLRIEFFDRTNRYFGDYHRVFLQVRCSLAVDDQLLGAALEDLAALERSRRLLGDRVEVMRSMERMGVAGADVEKVREALLEGFAATALPYMQSEGYPLMLVRKRLQECRPRTAGPRFGPS